MGVLLLGQMTTAKCVKHALMRDEWRSMEKTEAYICTFGTDQCGYPQLQFIEYLLCSLKKSLGTGSWLN